MSEKERAMSDAREVRTSDGRTLTAAQVAAHEGILRRLAWPSLHWGVEGVHSDAWPHIAMAAADAIQSAGWTPPGERVKPSVEDVARRHSRVSMDGTCICGAVGIGFVLGYGEHLVTETLALFPGRTETEVRAEAWDEGAQAGLDAGLSIAEAVHANGGVLNLADVPHAPVNPYRKEADRG